MQQNDYNNFQPDNYLASSNGEIFQVKEKTTYFCKGCTCQNYTTCQKAKEMSGYVLESVQTRKLFEVTQAYVLDKFEKGEIKEVTYTKGQWR